MAKTRIYALAKPILPLPWPSFSRRSRTVKISYNGRGRNALRRLDALKEAKCSTTTRGTAGQER